MSDSEKLMALKKAYADIILNTAKEAAARIMVSERKAFRCQQELFAAKEDALRMLLRLKQMLDAKVNEAQVTSLCQQRKIEELEAQLGEAEDIVKDLRAELREAQDELERAAYNQKQILAEQHSTGNVTTVMTPSLENRLDNSEAMIPCQPGVRPESTMSSDVKNLTFNGLNEKKCYSENGLHKDNCYFCNSGFASIVMRRKEPKLYRNGCTQRIHAFERKLLEGNLSLQGQVEEVKYGMCAEEYEDLCKNLDPGANQMCGVENNPNEFILMQTNRNPTSVHAVKSFRKKRKRAVGYKKSRTLSSRNFPHQVVETTQNPDISSRTLLNAVDNYVKHKEESKIVENNVEKNPDSRSALSSDKSEMILQSGCGEVTKSDTAQNTTNKDDPLIDRLELTRPESGPAEITEVPACKTDLEDVNLALVNSNVKSSNLIDGVATQVLNDKFLKYTFQRKRKKETLSSPDGYSSLEEGVMKRKTVENLNGSMESENSSLISASSRGSQRLVRVASQLISLSENKQ